MSIQDISQVSISLNSSGVTRAGFGTPLFITAHNYYTDRVRQYTGTTQVATDMTTASNGYAAAVSTFVNQPSVDTLKIGRLIASSEISPKATGAGGTVEEGITYTITVTDESGVTVDASYTTIAQDTLADIVDGLVSDITGSSVDVTVTDNGDSFTIARPLPDNDFVLSGILNVEVDAVDDGNTEDILVALQAIRDEDDDFYVVAWENHTDKTEILALADTIESLEKLYFYGSQQSVSINETFSIGDEPTSPNDMLANLANGGYARTIGWWHQDANKDFNELTFAGYNLPYDAGSVTWANIQVPVTNAKNPSGNKLTPTQEQNLADRNANWASIKGNIVYSREGKVIGDEWIDTIRGRDNLKSDLTADIFDLLTNQQGGKIPYTDAGINMVAGVVGSRLNRYKVDRGFLTDPIKLNIPKAKDIAREDKVNRILNDLSFTATLAGAIQLVDLTGTLEV